MTSATVTARDTSVFDTGTSPVSKRVSADDCRAGLAEASVRRQVAEALRADAMLDLTDWIRAAHAHGIAIAEIARLAGVTRQTVYTLLGGPRPA